MTGQLVFGAPLSHLFREKLLHETQRGPNVEHLRGRGVNPFYRFMHTFDDAVVIY